LGQGEPAQCEIPLGQFDEPLGDMAIGFVSHKSPKNNRNLFPIFNSFFGLVHLQNISSKALNHPRTKKAIFVRKGEVNDRAKVRR